MAWTVRNFGTLLDSQGDALYRLKEGLVDAGAEVYGSGDGSTSFDNSGAGAVDYWSDDTVPATVDTWCRLRWPSVDGVIRECLIDTVSIAGTIHRHSVHWSSDGTGFATGGSATARPTAADEQYVVNGSDALVQAYSFDSGASNYMTLITGDADEGYSWLWWLNRPAQSSLAPWSGVLFMDVLEYSPPAIADADPAVYGAMSQGSSTFPAVFLSTEWVFNTVQGTSDNCIGWFNKGEPNEAWVVYPLCGWGTANAVLNSGDEATQVVGAQPYLQNGDVDLRCFYTRASDRGFSTELGMKGVSRIFGRCAQSTQLFPNSRYDRKHVGYGWTIPWDGSTQGRGA